MNKEQEEGFFNQIEEVLYAHEETYELGAWEEFDANRKRNKRKWPIYGWAAAAVILLFVGFGFFEITRKDELPNNPIVVKKQAPSTRSLKNNVVAVPKSEKTGRTHKIHENNANVAIKLPAQLNIIPNDQVIATEKLNQQVEKVVAEYVVLEDDKVVQKDIRTNALQFDKINKNTPVLAGAYDSLMNHNRAVTPSSRKLTYSLVVSPSMSNQKINFGAGMELSYKVGQRLSIHSGLMYSALHAKSDGKSLVTTNDKSQGASLAVSGVELPLGIQYQTHSGFYASAGVSALGLINDRLEYSFLEEKTVGLPVNIGGTFHEVLKVVSEKKTEESIEPLNNYIGFFNFSAGKKQAFGNINLNIGPFVKVPFNSVSSEKIKLLQGGIKVSFDF